MLLDIAPRSLDEYLESGGGRGLEVALGAWPEAVIEGAARSGLRGRGGAGFPTGEKWRSGRCVGAGPLSAVWNENPTLLNNVEPLANVPHIMADGADWLRANGTDTSPGTMLFTVCGDVRREGVFELPMGTPLRHLVEDLAGGPAEGRTLKALFPGASNTVMAPEELDTPMDFDSMRQVGSGLGSGGFAVFDDSACMVKAARVYSRFLYGESCGQCPAAKFG